MFGWSVPLITLQNVLRTSWNHIVGCVHNLMDSGVRRLYVDVAGVSDGGAVSYEFIRQEYTFEVYP